MLQSSRLVHATAVVAVGHSSNLVGWRTPCGPSPQRSPTCPPMTESTAATPTPAAGATTLAPPAAPVAGRSWLRSLTTAERRVLIAAGTGWMFDSMDFLIYVLAIGRLKSYFGFGDATAGLLGTLT